MTYFWNGNRSEKFDEKLETFEEVPSDVRSFDEAPWMKAAEVTDKVIAAIESGKYGFIRCNYPNGDMVGHTGNLDATRLAVESVDLELRRVWNACKAHGCVLLVTADHGNADEMLQKNKKGELQPRTAHSLNPVPFIICDDEPHALKDGKFGLANVAPTVAQLLGLIAPRLLDGRHAQVREERENREPKDVTFFSEESNVSFVFFSFSSLAHRAGGALH